MQFLDRRRIHRDKGMLAPVDVNDHIKHQTSNPQIDVKNVPTGIDIPIGMSLQADALQDAPYTVSCTTSAIIIAPPTAATIDYGEVHH